MRQICPVGQICIGKVGKLKEGLDISFYFFYNSYYPNRKIGNKENV